jgi:hypothetical protein
VGAASAASFLALIAVIAVIAVIERTRGCSRSHKKTGGAPSYIR